MNEPSDSLVDVGGGVRESLSLSGLSTAGEEKKRKEGKGRRTKRDRRGQLEKLMDPSSSKIVGAERMQIKRNWYSQHTVKVRSNLYADRGR